MTVGGDHMIYWGCPYSCTYCINHAYRALYSQAGGRYVRHYGVKRIIDELEGLVERWGITFFKFHDEDFCLKPLPYFRALAEEYRNRVSVPFTIMANGKSITSEKVKLLKHMNCVSVSIGIETGNVVLRREILQRHESREDIVRSIHMLNDAGIRTCAFNMLGIPGETRETVFESIAVNRDSEVRYPDTVFFYPLEGTDLHKLSISKGLFSPNTDLLFDDVNPNLDLPGISRKELIALRERFVLYVKLPDVYQPFIERSEHEDEIGHKLMEELCKIYDTAVLANDGRWDPSRPIEDDIRILEMTASGNRAESDNRVPEKQ
jgi:radical SAM superfamily enzyme YgiQ (UPF0313 family)